MKALALAAGLVLAPAAASAGTLIAGAARDTDGFVLTGAAVVATAAGGQVVGRAVTGTDGTFAIDATGEAAALDVSCPFCVPQHVVLTGAPPAIVVVRYAALRDRSPGADDLAALPYDRLAQVASLVPFAVVTPNGFSDRGLGGGHGATQLDGISYYRISDGRDLVGLVPLGATSSLAAVPAGFAARYGQPAEGGLFQAATLGDSALALRGGGDGGAGVLRLAGPVGAAALAESDDAGAIVRRATARFDAPVAGGTFSLVASTAGDGTDATAGTLLRYAAGLPGADAIATLSAGESRSAYGGAGSDVAVDVHLHGRGTQPWDIGLRNTSASAAGPGSVVGNQATGALYADARYDVRALSLTGALALENDVESAGPMRWQTAALLPSFTLEERLGGGFALRASTTAAIQDPYLAEFGGYGYVYTAPSPFVRTDVVDAGLSYSDARRVRVDAVAYAQRAGDVADHINGLGLDAAWQVTPQLSLRSWALAAFAGANLALPPAVAYAGPPAAAPLRRQVTWLTYRNGLRIDLLDRGAGLDGSVALPLGRTFTLVAGTFGKMPGRIVTVELRALR